MSSLRDVWKRSWSDRKSVLYVVLILTSVCLLAAVILVWKLKGFRAIEQICSTKECLKSSFFFMNILATDIDPCDNFYNFTCGNYKGHLLLHNFQEEIDRNIRQFITSSSKESDSRSVKLQKQYYQACMNITGIEEDQNETLKKLYEELGGWPILKGNDWNESNFELGRVVEKSKEIGFYYDWFINVKNYDESIYDNKLFITIPDNVNTIDNDDVKERYLILMTNVAVMMGAPGNLSDISENMKGVMDFEIGLLKIIQDSRHNATYKEYTVDKIKYKYPNTPWSSLLKYLIFPRTSKVIFSLDSYIPQLEKYLNETSKRIQSDYIFWKLTESFSALLTYGIRQEFETYSDLSINYEFSKDRENYCYGITSTVFAYVSEAEFVREYAVEKESIREMVNSLSQVLRKHLADARWMNEELKSISFEKIQNMSIIIGGPDEMYNESVFENLLGIDKINFSGLSNTVEIICEADRSRDLFNLDFTKPKLNVNQARIYQGVSTLGYIKYMPDENILFLPAAALDGIFYSSKRLSYLNYGAIGTIIGHELAHGFGLLGNLGLEATTSLNNDTIKRFLEAAKCLLDDCNNIGINNTMNMHCAKTFEENFADYAGINIAYQAYLAMEDEQGKEISLPGLDYNPHQLFWIVYSSIMCNNIEVNSTEGLIHMLPFQRILGAFRNSEHFSKDFSCPVGSNMNPEAKCKIL